jgi:hypothetical protein
MNQLPPPLHFPLINRASRQARGLGAAWPLFASAGAATRLWDYAGGFHAAINGATWVATDRGNALSLNGSSNYCLNSAFTLLNGAAAGSLAVWFRSGVGQAGKYMLAAPLLSSGSNGFDLGVFTSAAVRSFLTTTNTGTDLRVTVNWPDSQWHLLVATYDGSRHLLYVDGALGTSATASGTIRANSNELNIGRFGSFGGYFNGVIDEPRVYLRALSAAEVYDLYRDPWGLYRRYRRTFALTTSPYYFQRHVLARRAV